MRAKYNNIKREIFYQRTPYERICCACHFASKYIKLADHVIITCWEQNPYNKNCIKKLYIRLFFTNNHSFT